MSFVPFIDVAVGLIFTYLLLGLIVTAMQELIASFTSARGKLMRDTIAQLVANGSRSKQFFKDVYKHPLITSSSASKLPSYMPSNTFALAVVDALSDDSQMPVFSQIENGLKKIPEGPSRDSLTVLICDAGGDITVLKASLACWFDDAMDRASGVYKRRSQTFALFVGAVVAVSLNIDSINIANQLWLDQTLRNNTVTAAEAFTGSATGQAAVANSAAVAAGTAPTPTVAEARADLATNVTALNNLALPIGWHGILDCDEEPTAIAGAGKPKPGTVGADVQNPQTGSCHHAGETLPVDIAGLPHWVRVVFDYFVHLGWVGALLLICGWAITALAVSLGAPFWFNLLENAFSIRGAGPKPPRGAESCPPGG